LSTSCRSIRTKSRFMSDIAIGTLGEGRRTRQRSVDHQSGRLKATSRPYQPQRSMLSKFASRLPDPTMTGDTRSQTVKTVAARDYLCKCVPTVMVPSFSKPARVTEAVRPGVRATPFTCLPQSSRDTRAGDLH
jgi:hypothetical protein